MSTPLLTTKLFIPPTSPELVPRPHLIERLDGGLHRKLSLISAPAGFGKTSLAAEWLDNLRVDAKNKIIWFSLDEGDNDITRFLIYFITALNRVEVEDAMIGKEALSMLQSPQPPPIETTLISLINEMAAFPDKFILVLDDYHLIETQPIHDAISFLLEHLPLQMHLVIATRDDPRLPLARLRTQGQLTELRAADLRFSSAKAAEFLNQVMGLNLSAEEITALETRTEGWIAGLQMAAISMRGREDTASFIQAFTGSHHFVIDYLVEEVLQRQPEHVRSFLLQTSILDRLNGPLCDAVTRLKDGRGTLKTLERGNLFVVPLDDQRQWYRYHHLFADVLHTHLLEAQPDQVSTLHQRASAWYEQNSQPSEAVRHALAAENYERVAGIAEMAWEAMDNSFQSAAWLDWMKSLPDDLIRNRPVLSTQYASALWMSGELEASETRLRDAERWLDPAGDESARAEGSADRTCPERSRRMVVVDEDQFRKLPITIALVRAYNAESQGDVSSTVKYANLALKLTSDDDLIERAQATVTLGFTYWASGDLESAHRAIAGWIDSMQQVGNIVFVIASTFALADIMVAQGRLREAVRAYKGSLQLASQHDEHVQRIIAHLYLGLAMLYHEMGDQEAAARHMLKGKELGEQSTLPDWPYRWCLAQARLQETRGDLDAALDLLNEAKRVYVRNSIPDIRPVEALKARVYIRQDRLTEALGWARERGLSVDDELSYLREFEHITLARVLIAQDRSNPDEQTAFQVIGLLDRLLKAAEDGRRIGSVIEILALQALAHQAQGDISVALAPLERALALAEPEGYFRIFVDEGPAMEALLTRMKDEIKGMKGYIHKLLAAFSDEESPPPSPRHQHLVDPISEREAEVLKLLTTELSGPEIARELTVSLATIRTHTQNIYSKLGVNNRRAAIRRAEELDLL